MKIAMFTDTYFPQVSGVATSIKILVDELEKRGHEVVIFTTSDPDAKGKIEKNIVRIPSIPFLFFTDRRMVISGMNKVYKIAKEKQFDLVHTHTEFGMGLIGKYVAYKLKIPIVHTYHTMYEKYLHYIANGHIVKPKHVQKISKYFCNSVSGIVAPGEKMANILKSYAIETTIQVIPTGVTVPVYNEENKIKLREFLGISKDEIVLLSLSRISKEKKIEKIIQAMPEIVSNVPNATLVVVGEGPYRQSLEELTKTLSISDYVKFVGEIPNELVCQYYQMADVYVNASDTETQGLTYLEALVNKLPVIAKKNEYLETIIKDDQLGKLFNQDEDLANTVIQYLSISNKTLSKDYNQLLYNISADKFVEDIVRFYVTVSESYQQNKTNSENPKATLLNKLYFSNWFKS